MLSRSPTLSVALLIAVSAATPAIAQAPQAQTPSEIDTITVIAPRITYQVRREGGSVIPSEVSIAEKSALVKFGDLDLTRTADLYTLEERINEAAARVCAELAQQFPDGTPNTEICTRRATDDAMAQVQQTARRAATQSSR